MKCSKTNYFGNLVFPLKLPRANIPSRITELWNKKTVPDAPIESQFPFLPAISRACNAENSTSQTVLELSSGAATLMHFCQIWRVVPTGTMSLQSSDKQGQADATVGDGWTPGSTVTSPASRVWGSCDSDSRGNHDGRSFLTLDLTSFF